MLISTSTARNWHKPRLPREGSGQIITYAWDDILDTKH